MENFSSVYYCIFVSVLFSSPLSSSLSFFAAAIIGICTGTICHLYQFQLFNNCVWCAQNPSPSYKQFPLFVVWWWQSFLYLPRSRKVQAKSIMSCPSLPNLLKSVFELNMIFDSDGINVTLTQTKPAQKVILKLNFTFFVVAAAAVVVVDGFFFSFSR